MRTRFNKEFNGWGRVLGRRPSNFDLDAILHVFNFFLSKSFFIILTGSSFFLLSFLGLYYIPEGGDDISGWGGVASHT